ncbi:MAG: helix-turn-helix transcriptional regulator [Verrucomicrobia bacterium]|jgi:DNA-binding HxlR family transcriptional regulator|nr:helix-turn-helix transcriptional regulator [Verrucomicrobiota bacterium]MBV8416950.1 helix-turn-helix transcriptional regulator [Verrucomicrobiota bacterium]MBV8642122.1 helix-turn-helix transcriptional regulator [Verrucomicrobiota bacterium]
MRHMNYDGPGCPVEACTEVIAGKWKGEILYLLLSGSKRHGELRRLIPNITQRMLTNQLRELEAAGIVQRCVMEGISLRVEYSLTASGKDLEPVIKAAWQWGRSFLEGRATLLTSNRSLVPTDT